MALMFSWPIIHVVDAFYHLAMNKPVTAVALLLFVPPLVVALPALFFGAAAYGFTAGVMFLAWGVYVARRLSA